MSQSVNISACPFHGYMHTYGARRHGLPTLRRVQPVAPHLRLYMEKVTLAAQPIPCYLRRTWWMPKAGPVQLHPGEVCWTLPEWCSVSIWARMMIRLHEAGGSHSLHRGKADANTSQLKNSEHSQQMLHCLGHKTQGAGINPYIRDPLCPT